MKRSSPKTQQSTAEEGKVGEHTYIQNVYSSPLPPRTQNPRKRMRSVRRVQHRDKAPSAEERPGWISGPSCSALSPGGGSGWAENIGGPTEGPREKERVGRYSTGHLLQDTPVLSQPANTARARLWGRRLPKRQNVEANTLRSSVSEPAEGRWQRFTKVQVKLFPPTSKETYLLSFLNA